MRFDCGEVSSRCWYCQSVITAPPYRGEHWLSQNPAGFGKVVDFIDAGLFLVKTILQGFDCDIESDFVPKFETVGDGLRG